MNIAPIWLKSLLAVLNSGSFTRAAEQLNLTQAAVSQHIQRLEQEFGQIFLRQGRTLELTPIGELVCTFAKQVIEAEGQLRQRLVTEDPYVGEVKLATPGSIGLAIYPKLLKLQKEHSQLRFHHRFAPTQEIVNAVIEKRVDFGLTTIRPDDERLSASPFATEPLQLVLPASETQSDWETLKRLGFIDHPDGQEMATRLLARHYPTERFSELPIAGFINQIGLILQPVAQGLGFTILPRFAIRQFAEAEKIRTVELHPDVVDTLWLVQRAEWPLSAAAETTVNYLKRHCCENLGPWS